LEVIGSWYSRITPWSIRSAEEKVKEMALKEFFQELISLGDGLYR
jgi:hypothetical protein